MFNRRDRERISALEAEVKAFRDRLDEVYWATRMYMAEPTSLGYGNVSYSNPRIADVVNRLVAESGLVWSNGQPAGLVKPMKAKP